MLLFPAGSAPNEGWRSFLSNRLLLLAWLGLIGIEIAFNGIIAFERVNHPQLALNLREDDSLATVSRVQELVEIRTRVALAAAQGKAAPPDASNGVAAELLRAQMERALAREPLAPNGIGTLGQLQERSAARAYMKAALAINKSNQAALLWQIDDDLRESRHTAALENLDLLFRANPATLPGMSVVLVALLAKPASEDATRNLLMTNPPWLGQALALALPQISSPGSAARLFADLRRASVPVDPRLLGLYAWKILNAGKVAESYDFWRSQLTAPQSAKLANLYNGDFSLPSGGSPFDWATNSVKGVSISFVGMNDGKPYTALRLRYGPGQAAPHSVSQFWRLAPGSYRFSGELSGELRNPRGQIWRVVCAFGGHQSVIGQSTPILGSRNGWAGFEFNIKVPQSDCPLQQVQLFLDGRTASEMLASGEILYKFLQLKSD